MFLSTILYSYAEMKVNSVKHGSTKLKELNCEEMCVPDMCKGVY